MVFNVATWHATGPCTTIVPLDGRTFHHRRQQWNDCTRPESWARAFEYPRKRSLSRMLWERFARVLRCMEKLKKMKSWRHEGSNTTKPRSQRQIENEYAMTRMIPPRCGFWCRLRVGYVPEDGRCSTRNRQKFRWHDYSELPHPLMRQTLIFSAAMS